MAEMRDRDEIERDLSVIYGVANCGNNPNGRLADDVGPLLERLDQQTAEIERLRSEQREHSDYAQHLINEGLRFRSELSAAQSKSAEWRRLWRDRYRNLWGISEQYRAELAAAQTRAEPVRAMHQPHKSVWTLGGWRGACGVDGAIYPCPTLRALGAAGDAARPQPEGGDEESDAEHAFRVDNIGDAWHWVCRCTASDGDFTARRYAEESGWQHLRYVEASRPLPEPEQPPIDEEICHCGQPVDTSEYRNRGMCTHCDDVRCDAYPGECKPKPLRHQPASSFGYAYCAVCRADWPCHAAKEQTGV